MKVFYSTYNLKPKKKANRLSDLASKPGVYLRAELNNKVYFADYFPHLPLGDRSVDEFLAGFKFQHIEYDKKVFHLLLQDHAYQKVTPKAFKNHQLWNSTDKIDSPFVKYKLLDLDDRSFMLLLDQGIKVRLDANGLFNKETYLKFMSEIPKEHLPLIEYIEDPLSSLDWSNLLTPNARDFISGDPFDFYIYKPNCEFYPETKARIIFSSYLGNTLGLWHSYCELVTQGDLSLRHGIYTSGFYEEEASLFQGNYYDGFSPSQNEVKTLYKKLDQLNWKSLCSM